jgi:ABC-type uncharacterized transport system fused permease/ATPase subunit
MTLQARKQTKFYCLFRFLIFIVIFSTIFKIITQYAVNRFASLQRHYFSTRLLKIYLQQNYEFFIQRNSATLVKNILSEVDQLIWTMILPALTLMSYGVVLLAMIGIFYCMIR